MKKSPHWVVLAVVLGGCSVGRMRTNARIGAVTEQAPAKAQTVRFDGVVDAINCDVEQALVVSRRTPNDGKEYTVDLRTAWIRSVVGTTLACRDVSVGDVVDVRGAVRQNRDVDAASVVLETPSEPEHNGEGGGNATSPGF
jgi:hypothetical protein